MTQADPPKPTERDRTEIRPYGDTMNDGQIQMSFTLPVEAGPEADAAARQLVTSMGFKSADIYHSEDLGEDYTFFIVYGSTDQSVDLDALEVPTLQGEAMSFHDINEYICDNIGRRLVILGACTGTDAHSVGIDAIMNPKGYDGEYGLERYPEIEAHNLGMQIPNDELVARAIQDDADALLVSQVVTQNDVHLDNLADLIDILEAEGLRDELVVVCGGPRITHELAVELGYDAGFSSGTTARDVASFIARDIVDRNLT
jgi:beta-lysine 5,6-aminomutase beta subunit